RPMRPEAPATTTRRGRGASSGERRLKSDLDPRERLRDGAARLRLFRNALEVGLLDAGDDGRDVEVAAADPGAGSERHGRRGLERLRRGTVLRQRGREGHAEARRV